ncbi:MAG: chorismate mutase [Sphingopyxis sp.]|uniref:chorismate mutase n=1 Tax=Sphingopyxis sp. TaxID=1908224 RepID=UPI001A49FCE8|nr:chorismate mutase [Sphingopyxis sp.]MBL9070050.1 chorismate mutase [Sphingopyxis sp.]
MTAPKLPQDCETMRDVRAGVDQVDRELVAILARRFGYMDAAARIKPDRESVRDEARKAEVLDNVAREAEEAGLEPARLRAVWNELVEQSIAYEVVRWDRLRTGG